MAVAERQGSAEANHAPASVSHYLHDSYEVGDAPLCVTCGSLMVRDVSCHKCANCPNADNASSPLMMIVRNIVSLSVRFYAYDFEVKPWSCIAYW